MTHCQCHTCISSASPEGQRQVAPIETDSFLYFSAHGHSDLGDVLGLCVGQAGNGVTPKNPQP